LDGCSNGRQYCLFLVQFETDWFGTRRGTTITIALPFAKNYSVVYVYDNIFTDI